MNKELKLADLKPIEVATTEPLVSWTKRDIKTAADLIAMFREYYEAVGHGVLSMAGFATFIGHAPSSFACIKDAFPEQFAFIRQAIEKSLVEKALVGEYNASFAQFILRNRFDYNEADVQINQFSTSPEDVAKIKQSLRQMREQKKEEE